MDNSKPLIFFTKIIQYFELHIPGKIQTPGHIKKKYH